MNEKSGKSWEIHSSDLRITESNVILLPVSQLTPHPDNRPLGASEDKIGQLKIFIAQNGFDSSHPLVVRPYQNSYQIIEGERMKTTISISYCGYFWKISLLQCLNSIITYCYSKTV